MSQLDDQLVWQLRSLAKEGRLPSEIFNHARVHLGQDAHAIDVFHYFREAFFLTFSEATAVISLARSGNLEASSEPFFNETVQPEIDRHRQEWMAPLQQPPEE